MFLAQCTLLNLQSATLKLLSLVEIVEETMRMCEMGEAEGNLRMSSGKMIFPQSQGLQVQFLTLFVLTVMGVAKCGEIEKVCQGPRALYLRRFVEQRSAF